jgi:two-component system, chemotaxis family, chemotaxis protein CheY
MILAPHPTSSLNLGALPGARCLVADASPIMRRFASSLMRHADCEVNEALSGMAVLDWCRRLPFDFILLDWDLPIMDGLTCLRLLRAAQPDHRPLVAIASPTHHPTRIRHALECGADDYIIKPFFVDSLWATVDQLRSVRVV